MEVLEVEEEEVFGQGRVEVDEAAMAADLAKVSLRGSGQEKLDLSHRYLQD